MYVTLRSIHGFSGAHSVSMYLALGLQHEIYVRHKIICGLSGSATSSKTIS
jgi:hypothetical protein